MIPDPQKKAYLGVSILFIFFTLFVSPSVQAQNRKFDHQLVEAILADDVQLVSELIEAGADVNKRFKKGKRPIHYAASNGNPGICELLIDSGADIRVTDKWKNTALHLAAVSGDPELIALLLENGADINALDKYGNSPLSDLMMNADEATIHFMIEHGARACGKIDGIPLLIYALENFEDESLFAELIAAGADIHVSNTYGYEDPYEMSAFEIALERDYYKTAAILLKEGAKPVNYIMEEPVLLYICNNYWVDKKDKLALLEELFKKGVDPDMQVDSIPVLAFLLEYGMEDADILSLFIKYGTDPDTKIQNTPILKYMVETYGFFLSYDLYKLMISKGANPNIMIHGEPMSIYLFKREESFGRKYTDVILSADINLEARDARGRTLLACAARKGDLERVKLLLEKGADINAADHKGKIPLDHALDSGNKEVVTYLKEKAAARKTTQG